MQLSTFARKANLFWRTFILLMFLIVFTVMGWVQSLRVLNETPFAEATAQQIVSIANLTRYALVTADPVYRPDLLMVLANREGLRVLPKEETDDVVTLSEDPITSSSSTDEMEAKVKKALGDGTVLASSVNGEPGLWVSIAIDDDHYWLMTSSTILTPQYGKTWVWWALAAFVASILGTVLITSRLTAPLQKLSESVRDFGQGKMPAELPVSEGPEELREVNASFNRMVFDINRMEQDRELLLAGVSHDLRTPITRLRLETELADLPKGTHDAMVSDMEQMESIVNQFMDYARRNTRALMRVNLSEIVENTVKLSRIGSDPGVRYVSFVEPQIFVMGQNIELTRVIQNLYTNAVRYGKSEDGILDFSIELKKDGTNCLLTVSDLGQGLDMSQTERLMRPFERGDSARGGTTGTGLGLAIVDRVIRSMSGSVRLMTSNPHGLTVQISLPMVLEAESK